ncbi:MAG: cytochrome c5 family protein [Burkholderiales bacterium]|nr:cytochrome c5 family protein [Burkholderiales bacterium]
MAASELDDHTGEHASFIRTPKQLLTVVVLAFAIPVSVLVMLAVLASDINRYGPDHPAMSDEAIARRIRPVGQVRLAEAGAKGEPAPAAAAQAPAAAAPAAVAAAPSAAAAAPAPAAATAIDGKAIYSKVCFVCHATGVAGAPKAGDKAAWGPRIKEGMDVVYSIAIKGKGAMPPRGGAAQLSDADVKAAVDYMVSLAK